MKPIKLQGVVIENVDKQSDWCDIALKLGLGHVRLSLPRRTRDWTLEIGMKVQITIEEYK